MTTSHQCKECEGRGRMQTSGGFMCCICHGTGDSYEWQSDFSREVPGARCLSNSDVDSDPVTVSNLRVWEEMHAESRGELWRMRNGGYGSRWVEFRAGLAKLLTDASKRADMELIAKRFGLSQITSIIETLEALDGYPILDEDDESRAEQEEQEEHWESYGRDEFERLLMNRADELGLDFDRNGPEIDAAYWRACESVRPYPVYPERIDSSAWNFHIEVPTERRSYGRSEVYNLVTSGDFDAELMKLCGVKLGPLTVAEFAKQQDAVSCEVWKDYARDNGLSVD